MSLVEVRPLDLKKWHNKTGKDNFASPIIIEAFYNDSAGGYDTGLDDEEAQTYGKALGVDLSNRFNPEEPHPFYGSRAGQIDLPAYTKIFDTGNTRDLVKVKLMKAQSTKQVANSLKEWEEGKWVEATHYIHDEAEESEVKASKITRKRKANEIVNAMSGDAKRAYIMVISGKNLKGKSDSMVDVEIDDIIENNIGEFFRVYNLSKEEILLTAQVKEMLSKNILTKQGSSVYYLNNPIGYNEDDAVKYFQDPNNSKLKASLLDKLSLR